MPHADKKIKAKTGLFAAIFPVQTKSAVSIVIWSMILLLDVVLAVLCAFRLDVLNLESFSKVTVVLVLIAALVLFCLQGVLWSAAIKMFRKN